MPARMSTKDFWTRPWRVFIRSRSVPLSPSFRSHSSTSFRDPAVEPPEKRISSTAVFSFWRSSARFSIRDVASEVILTRFAWVSSWVRNFWITCERRGIARCEWNNCAV